LEPLAPVRRASPRRARIRLADVIGIGLGLSEGRSPATRASGNSNPMIEAGEPSTEVIVAKQEMPAPPGVVILAPQTLLRNASMAQS
jgi:hypothetical protein